MKPKKAKQIQRFKQGKIKLTKREVLFRRRKRLIKELLELNNELHSGRKMGLLESLNKVYTPYLSKKGESIVGGKLSVPLCLVGRKLKFKLVKKKQLKDEVGK